MQQDGVRNEDRRPRAAPAVMFAELERCRRCHRRYPAPFGHSCPQATFAEQRRDGLRARVQEAWLETSAGRFAQYLAARPAQPAR